ncbi:hypothetical protein HDU93_003579 [Gonapodya sp. JEL0774]|nr:hypothetical protein HDU93_003579 [Gonapodya sp. JEL0774]
MAYTVGEYHKFILEPEPAIRVSSPAHHHLIGVFNDTLVAVTSERPPPLSVAVGSATSLPSFTRGVPSMPYAEAAKEVVTCWLKTGVYPFRDVFELSRRPPNVASTFSELPDERERLDELKSLISSGTDSSSPETIADYVKSLKVPLLLHLLGVRFTVGSALDTLPPSLNTCLSSFLAVHPKDIKSKFGGLTVGAKALTKHHHRDKTTGFWGNVTGTVDEKNQHACRVLAKIIAGAVWINIHRLPHEIRVFEVRTMEGYGARWYVEKRSAEMDEFGHDGDEFEVTFRGFLEPQMEDGHEVGWLDGLGAVIQSSGRRMYDLHAGRMNVVRSNLSDRVRSLLLISNAAANSSNPIVQIPVLDDAGLLRLGECPTLNDLRDSASFDSTDSSILYDSSCKLRDLARAVSHDFRGLERSSPELSISNGIPERNLYEAIREWLPNVHGKTFSFALNLLNDDLLEPAPTPLDEKAVETDSFPHPQYSSFTKPYLALLTLTSLTERFLGDVLFTLDLEKDIQGPIVHTAPKGISPHHEKRVKRAASAAVPFLLADLLLKSELITVLGEDLVLILRILLGTPLALNLRNLFWHGFALERDFSQSESCRVWAEVVTVALATSMSRVRGHFGERRLRCRDSAYFCGFYCNHDLRRALPEALLGRFTSSARPPDSFSGIGALSTLANMFRQSAFCSPSSYHAWDHLLHVYPLLSLDAHARFIFLLVSLPLLEAELRRAYVHANNLPAERVVTAHSEVYYTTLDTMLVEEFCVITPNVEQNATEAVTQQNGLPHWLGTGLHALLMDLFHYMRGPRVRDRFSHGSVGVGLPSTRDCEGVCTTVCFWIMAVLVELAIRGYVGKIAAQEEPFIVCCRTAIREYRPLFHDVIVAEAAVVDISMQTLRTLEQCWTLVSPAIWGTGAFSLEHSDLPTLDQEPFLWLPALSDVIRDYVSANSSSGPLSKLLLCVPPVLASQCTGIPVGAGKLAAAVFRVLRDSQTVLVVLLDKTESMANSLSSVAESSVKGDNRGQLPSRLQRQLEWHPANVVFVVEIVWWTLRTLLMILQIVIVDFQRVTTFVCRKRNLFYYLSQHESFLKRIAGYTKEGQFGNEGGSSAHHSTTMFSAPPSSTRRRGGRPPKTATVSYRNRDDYPEPSATPAPAPTPTESPAQIQARLQALQPGKRLSKRAIQLELDRVRALEQQQRPFGGYFGYRRFQGRNRTKHKYFSKLILQREAQQPARLVPIRIDVEADNGNVKLSDWFLWNLNERLLTPEHFARVLLEDLHYTGANATLDGRFPDNIANQLIVEVAQEIRRQCSQSAGAVAEGWDVGSWGEKVWTEDGGLLLPAGTDPALFELFEPAPEPEAISEDEDDVARRKRDRERERKRLRRLEREREKREKEREEEEEEEGDGEDENEEAGDAENDEQEEDKDDTGRMQLDTNAVDECMEHAQSAVPVGTESVTSQALAPELVAPQPVLAARPPLLPISVSMDLDSALPETISTPGTTAISEAGTSSHFLEGVASEGGTPLPSTPAQSVGTPAPLEPTSTPAQLEPSATHVPPQKPGSAANVEETGENSTKAKYASARPGGVRLVNEVTADVHKQSVDDESRVVVTIDLTVGNQHLLDRFEYPLFPSATTLSPEHISHTICRDLSLPAEFLPMIAHSIREQVVNARLGIEETRFAGELKGKAFRKEEDEMGWGPGLEELGWDEVERVRKEKEKERRRRRIRQRGAPQASAPPVFPRGAGPPPPYAGY